MMPRIDGQSRSEPLILEVENNIAVLCLNRPAVHHAVDAQVMALWEYALDIIEKNSSLRCIIITAGGQQTFCAGGDLRYFSTLKTPDDCREMSLRMQAILERLYLGKRYVIAAVNGQALGGGCEIITACHYRIAANHVQFAFRQAPNGIVTGWGGGWRLISQLPRNVALRMLTGGETFSAHQGQKWGFFDEITESRDLLATAFERAENVAKNDAAAQSSFMEIANLAAEKHRREMAAVETERFIECWFGDTFQSILKKFGQA